MIRSRIWPSQNQGETLAGAIISLLISISVLGIAIEPLRPSGLLPLGVFLWRPIMLFAVLVLVTLFLKVLLKTDKAELALSLKRSLPWVLIFSAVLSLLPLWPKDFTALPLSLKEVGFYLLSVGFWPTISGPEGLMRGFVLGLALYLAWQEFRTSKDDIKSILVGVGSWISGSLALMLPYLVLSVTAMVSRLPSGSGKMLADSFSRLNLNTYWSNAQIVRWFTGFGGQLPNAMALYLLTWVFVIVAILFALGFVGLKNPIPYLKERGWFVFESFLVLSAVLVGLSVGWGRMQRSGLDLAAWLALAVALAGVLWLLAASREGEEVHVPVALVLFSGLLLGWPVLFPLLGLVLAVWLLSRAEEAVWSRGLLWLFGWLALAGASLGFIRLGATMSKDTAFGLMGLSILFLPAVIWQFWLNQKKNGAQITWSIWLVCGLVSAYVFSSLTPFAISIIGIIITGLWRKTKGQIGYLMAYAVIISSICTLFLAFWMPRWLNPRLLPL